MQDLQTSSAPATLTARDEPNTPADAAYSAPRSATPHLITYQPQLLVPARAPHSVQRYPANLSHSRSFAARPTTPNRGITVMRFADSENAEITIRDIGVSIDIELGAVALRTLAFQLLDAAYDIEQADATKGLAA